MHALFHGWRRKAGAITLVMSLALMVAWMRSRYVVDVVIVETGLGNCTAISAGEQAIVLFGDSVVHHVLMKLSVTVEMESEPSVIKSFSYPKWHHLVTGRPVTGLKVLVDTKPRFGISYSVFALPLTLLSAYLLLWTPRKRSSASLLISTEV